jgi:hypothetical protein
MTDPRQLISQKGWISVDFNNEVFIPCPPAFPEGMTPQQWAGGFARVWWETSGLEHGEAQIKALADTLLYLHGSIYGTLPCHLALIHLRDPRTVPLPVGFGVWPATGERETQLRGLACADDPAAIKPPVVEQFATSHLGPGLKCMCYLKDQKTVLGGLSYAWRSEEFETAVRMFTCTPDLGRLERAVPDLDELARVIRVVPRTQ